MPTAFQVAEVTRPLMSVSKICENGDYDVLCRKNEAIILDSKHNVVALFEKRSGLYVAKVDLHNPKHQGFSRQAR